MNAKMILRRITAKGDAFVLVTTFGQLQCNYLTNYQAEEHNSILRIK